ncbi:Putative PD-(D/E)XK family member (DUF4420) [Mycobacteriaceae bacterium]
MTESISPELWVDIANEAAADGTVVLRRVAPDLAHDVFIGERRPSRERVLWLEINGSVGNVPRIRRPAKGLDVEVDSRTPGRTKIRLASTSSSNNSLFQELANDVLRLLHRIPENGSAIRVLERVSAWQSFFAQRHSGFSPEKAAGLFAELTVLDGIFIPAIGSWLAVAGWTGPDPALQDFQFGTLAIEVKSFRGNGPGRMTISSERQLEAIGTTELYVAYLRLDQRSEGTGTTLIDMIKAVRHAVSDSPSAADLLDEKLLSYGWHDRFAGERSEKYEVRSSESFNVADDFPRIVSSDLMNGVGGVSYSIERSAIDAFLVQWGDFSQRLKGHL